MTDWIFVAVFGLAFIRGILATRQLRRIHLAETPPRNQITRAFWIVAALVTAAAGVIGALGARRLFGLDPLPGSAILTLLVTAGVLFIPDFLVWTVKRIRRGV